MIFSRDLLKSTFNKDSLFAILVDGESMQPLINHKAIIVADLSQKELIDKAIYLLYHGSKMWVKKYDQKSKNFVSINPKYSHLLYAQDEVHLVARVLLTFTEL